MERSVDVPARSDLSRPAPRARLATTLRRVAVIAVLTSSLVGAVVFIGSAAGTAELAQSLVFTPILLAYPIVGAIILWRRAHPIGWLLLALGVVLTASQLGSGLLSGTELAGTSGAWRPTVVGDGGLRLAVPTMGYRPTGQP